LLHFDCADRVVEKAKAGAEGHRAGLESLP